MKKLLTLLVTLFLLVSCKENISFPSDADGIYYGTLDVDGFSMDAGISLTENGDSTVDVFFDNVKFAVLMPENRYNSEERALQKRRTLLF